MRAATDPQWQAAARDRARRGAHGMRCPACDGLGQVECDNYSCMILTCMQRCGYCDGYGHIRAIRLATASAETPPTPDTKPPAPAGTPRE
jgi:DnaJ-class molecular chaperone